MSLEADEKIHVAMDTKESRGTGECIAPFTKKKKKFTIYIFLFMSFTCLNSGIRIKKYNLDNFFDKRVGKKKVFTTYKKVAGPHFSTKYPKGCAIIHSLRLFVSWVCIASPILDC